MVSQKKNVGMRRQQMAHKIELAKKWCGWTPTLSPSLTNRHLAPKKSKFSAMDIINVRDHDEGELLGRGLVVDDDIGGGRRGGNV